MQTRDEKIKKVLATAYNAILTAITNEDGLDGSTGNRVLLEILRLFKAPLPPVNHGKVEGCPYENNHTFSECGLDVPLDLSKDGFELK